MSYLHVSYLLLSVYEPSRGGGGLEGGKPLVEIKRDTGRLRNKPDYVRQPFDMSSIIHECATYISLE